MKVINVYPFPNQQVIGIPAAEVVELFGTRHQEMAEMSLSAERLFLLPATEYDDFVDRMNHQYLDGFVIQTIVLQNLIHWDGHWQFGEPIRVWSDSSAEVSDLFNALLPTESRINEHPETWLIKPSQYDLLIDIYTKSRIIDKQKMAMTAIPDMVVTPTPVPIDFKKFTELAEQCDGLPRLEWMIATVLRHTITGPFTRSFSDFTVRGDDHNGFDVVIIL